MQSETQTDAGSSPNAGGISIHSERRKQIKLTATPSRRALPAVIAAATDEGTDGRISEDTELAPGETINHEPAGIADAIGGDVLISLDRALRFSFANKAAEIFFGRSFDALRGRPIAALAPDAGQTDSELVTRILSIYRSGTPQSFDISFSFKEQPYLVFVTPHVEGVFVCLREMSARSSEITEIQEGRALVEQMIELAPEIIYIFDLAIGTNVYSNRNVSLSLGYTEDELESMTPERIAALTVREDLRKHDECREQFQQGATFVECEYRQRHKDGSIRWFRTRETIFGRDVDHSPRLILGFAEDITERRAVLDKLQEREEYLRHLTESSPDCILTLDLDGGLLQINPSGKALMEIEDFDPLIGAEWILLFQENYRPLAKKALNASLTGGTDRFQGIAKTALGTPLWWDVIVTPILSTTGIPTQIVTVARDISGFKALEAEREQLLQDAITRADIDSLTGLLNHRAFHRKLHEAATVDGESLPTLAIMLLDLENFRYFNEAYGRATGDDLLIRMAKEIASCCRGTDILARIGPDEFGIIAPDMQRAEIGPYVLRLRAAIDSIGMRSPDGVDTIPLHIAVGYALFPEDTSSVSGAYDIAEERQRSDQTGGHSREAERVRESLRENVDSFSMLDTLITTIDGKDRLTRRQSEDTLVYSRRIAEKFNLSPEQIRSLDIAALLHDVGKVGIDERILRQPGKLSDNDIAVIQQHPKIGAMLVGSTVDDVDTVEAILYHHENWNGSGYPAGLAGEDLPLLARVLNVASSSAAMTNNRPYRKGMTPSAAQKVLQTGAGTQWDPQCVAALITIANN